MLKKKQVKKYSEKVKKGFKTASKNYKKYAPEVKRGVQKAHKFFKAVGETAQESLTPMPHRGRVLDLTPQRVKVKGKTHRGQMKRVGGKKGGFYLDLT